MPRRRNRNREAVDPRLDCVIPGRMIWSILSRLPVKSLVRFKRVSRPWMDLFKNPAFINLHYNRFSQLPKTLSTKSQRITCANLDLNPIREFVPNPSDQLFLSSCNGLMCIGRPLVSKRILLWNPATRFWKVLPPPNGGNYCWRDLAMVSLGFTCNEEGDDYKVVRIICMKGKKMKAYVEVYSSKSDSWQKVDVNFKFSGYFVSHQAEVKGNLYWAVCNEAGNVMVLKFDSKTTSLEMMPMPSEVGEDPITFVNWEGQVAGLHSVGNWVDVWVYQEEQKAWRRKAFYEIEGDEGDTVDGCLAYNPLRKKIVGFYTNNHLFEVDVKKVGTGYGRGRGVSRYSHGLISRMYSYNESLAYVTGMREMNLAPDIKCHERCLELVADGFFTCLGYPGRIDVDIYYGLAY